MDFYNLPLDTLRKSQLKDAFFLDIIRYLDDNHLHKNVKCQNSVIAEAEHYLLFNTLLYHFIVKSSKTVEHKMALCISLEFCGYNYLLVIRCSHLHFIITDTAKTRKASEVAELLFQKLICANGTNIREIYRDFDTAFKNEIVCSILWVSQSSFVEFNHIRYQHKNAFFLRHY